MLIDDHRCTAAVVTICKHAPTYFFRFSFQIEFLPVLGFTCSLYLPLRARNIKLVQPKKGTTMETVGRVHSIELAFASVSRLLKLQTQNAKILSASDDL